MTASDQVETVHPVPERLLNGNLSKPYVSSMEQYKAMWEESVNNPDKFFGDVGFLYPNQ